MNQFILFFLRRQFLFEKLIVNPFNSNVWTGISGGNEAEVRRRAPWGGRDGSEAGETDTELGGADALHDGCGRLPQARKARDNTAWGSTRERSSHGRCP